MCQTETLPKSEVVFFPPNVHMKTKLENQGPNASPEITAHLLAVLLKPIPQGKGGDVVVCGELVHIWSLSILYIDSDSTYRYRVYIYILFLSLDIYNIDNKYDI